MKERVIEEAKNKLIKKIIRTRRDACASNSRERFLRIKKRVDYLEEVYKRLIKRSRRTYLMGKNEISTSDTIAELRTKTLEELKNLYN